MYFVTLWMDALNSRFFSQASTLQGTKRKAQFNDSGPLPPFPCPRPVSARVSASASAEA
jgi:hypothetical protein